MKSPALLLTIITAFCTAAVGQSVTNIAFDVRPAIVNNSIGASIRASNESGNSTSKAPRSAAAGRLERQVFVLLNAQRIAQGLKELEWNEEVAELARVHSQDMANEKFFSHRGSDGSMVDDRADRLGLGAWKAIGENIAFMRGFEDPSAVAVEKWMESTAHRKNLLTPNWTESAVGVVITADGTHYFTQVFLRK